MDKPKSTATTPNLLEQILGRKVATDERLSDDDMLLVGRYVMRTNREALAALAKS